MSSGDYTGRHAGFVFNRAGTEMGGGGGRGDSSGSGGILDKEDAHHGEASVLVGEVMNERTGGAAVPLRGAGVVWHHWELWSHNPQKHAQLGCVPAEKRILGAEILAVAARTEDAETSDTRSEVT